MAGNTQDKRVNDQKLRGMKDGETLTDSLGRGSGAILFRKQGSVITALYRYSIQKKSLYHTIGPFKSAASPAGMKLTDIRDKAHELIAIRKQHGDLKVYFAQQSATKDTLAQERRLAEEEAKKQKTFKDLLDWYVAGMYRKKQPKAKPTELMLKRHVLDKFPDIASRNAKEITFEDIALIVQNVIASKPGNRGRGNSAAAPASNMLPTADRIHSVICAAFNAAMTKKITLEHNDVQASEFGITHNPGTQIEPLSNVYAGDTESLQQAELGELLRYLYALDERKRAIALSAIYLGGQRLEMLVAVGWNSIDDEGMLMQDLKGREDPIPHFVPFTPRIREVMAPLLNLRLSDEGPYALTASKTSAGYVGKIFSDAGRQLKKEGKAEYFTWKNVRATCETILAALGVGENIRAHILSHGREGIQSKYYDRNSYFTEKLAALEMWGQYLDELADGKIRSGIRIQKQSELRGKLSQK